MPKKSSPNKPIPAPSARKMEDMLWRVACELRGNVDAPKYKNYILPLIFLKRLSDVFDDEIARLANEFGGSQNGLQMAETDHKLVRFFLPPEARWESIRQESPWPGPAKLRPNSFGERLNFAMRAVAENNSPLQDVVNINDFNASSGGEREVDDNSLRRVVDKLSEKNFRLGIDDVESDFLGRAYEYLLRKFAEGSGQSGGEHFTPPEVARLMARIVRPQPGETVHDFACGSGGLLIKCALALRQDKPKNQLPLKLFGQEISGDTFALARMNAILHGMDAEILRGDTMLNPKFRQNNGVLQQFDIVVANPMWNQPFPAMEDDPFARFQNRGGNAPGNADWAWLQHTMAALNPESGRAAVVLDTGAMTRSGAQKSIRKWFVQNDLVDSVILLPDKLFYNTSAAGIIVVLRARKPKNRRGKITLVNAANLFEKVGSKNRISDKHAAQIVNAMLADKNIKQLACVVKVGDIAENNWNMLPFRYVDSTEKEKIRLVPAIMYDQQKLREQERKSDAALSRVVASLTAQKKAKWKSTNLGNSQIAKILMGLSPPSSSYNENGIGLPFFQGSADFGLLHPVARVWCDAPSRISEPGDILISVRAPVGDINICAEKCCIGRGLAAIKNGPETDGMFLFYLLMASKRELEKRGKGSTFASIDKTDLRDFPVSLPPMAEQKRIAAIFAAINDRIRLADEKRILQKELLKSALNTLMGKVTKHG